jgi:hypothetical protein
MPTTINIQPETVDISLYQGDTVPIKIVAKDTNGAVVDLTGYSAKSTIYNNNNLPIANGFICSTPNSSGEVFIYLPDGTSDLIQTGYKYDVEIWKSESITQLGISRNVVVTLITGTFTVKSDVTEVSGGGRGQIS